MEVLRSVRADAYILPNEGRRKVYLFPDCALLDPKAADAALVTYLAYDEDKLEKLLEDPKLLRTPIVRNGKQATVGYCPEVWKTWT